MLVSGRWNVGHKSGDFTVSQGDAANRRLFRNVARGLVRSPGDVSIFSFFEQCLALRSAVARSVLPLDDVVPAYGVSLPVFVARGALCVTAFGRRRRIRILRLAAGRGMIEAPDGSNHRRQRQ